VSSRDNGGNLVRRWNIKHTYFETTYTPPHLGFPFLELGYRVNIIGLMYQPITRRIPDHWNLLRSIWRQRLDRHKAYSFHNSLRKFTESLFVNYPNIEWSLYTRKTREVSSQIFDLHPSPLSAFSIDHWDYCQPSSVFIDQQPRVNQAFVYKKETARKAEWVKQSSRVKQKIQD